MRRERPEVLERDPPLVRPRELVHRRVEGLDAAAVDEERRGEPEARLTLLDDEVLRERPQAREDRVRVALARSFQSAGNRLDLTQTEAAGLAELRGDGDGDGKGKGMIEGAKEAFSRDDDKERQKAKKD